MKAIATFLALSFIIAACQPIVEQTQPPPVAEPFASEATQELKKFGSDEELRAFLEANQGGSYGADNVAFDTNMAVRSMAVGEASGAPMPAAMQVDQAAEYSQTNVQVQGVDEADFVKNDGTYIYVLSGNKLVIVQAYPAEGMETVSETTIDGSPREFFVNGNKLILFTEISEPIYVFAEYDIIPSPRYGQRTRVEVYDISDRTEPELRKKYTVSGSYFQSRMIDRHVYLITRQDAYYYDHYVDVPRIMEGGITLVEPEIYYFDNPEDQYQFSVITSMDVESESVQSKSYLTGYASTVYMSLDNLFVAYQKNQPWWRHQEDQEARFREAILPLLPEDVRSAVDDMSSGLSRFERWDKIASLLEMMYDGMSEREQEDFIEKAREAEYEWELKQAQDRMKSVVHRIAIRDGAIEHEARGEVPGQLLNQFSLDEHDGNLRMATTTYLYTRYGSTTYNNVYILGPSMETIGSLEKLALDERIYSTRFMGDRLYMVTFQRIDPLFVIDLSNPRKPEVLGELKIPGFSDYLHPYDDTHIIGIGKETEGNQWGGISVKGVKVSLFDVSDVKKPRQVDMVEIGTAGSDSEALHDHKAFLFSREKSVLVLPIREVRESLPGSSPWARPVRVWQGAYVFDIDPAGIEVRGKVKHFEGEEANRYYWTSPAAIRRSLYMDEVLYTVSGRYVQANDLDSLEQVSRVSLPKEQLQYYGDGPVPLPRLVGSGVAMEE